MFLNIITPCSRPSNLWEISKSINIPRSNYRWLVIFDAAELPDAELIPDNCEVYTYQDANSTAGHAQRNFALDLITHGYIYSNDDDTVLHSDLWDAIKEQTADFISFTQLNKDNTVRLKGDIISVGSIDSHNFIVKLNTVSNVRFRITEYGADGYFAEECFQKAVTRLFINLPLSVYNILRDD